MRSHLHLLGQGRGVSAGSEGVFEHGSLVVVSIIVGKSPGRKGQRYLWELGVTWLPAC